MRSTIQFSSGAALATVEGGLDGRGRPVVRLLFVKPVGVDVLALVDTGFNGDLYMHQADALSVGLHRIGIRDRAQVAGGELRKTELSAAIVDWLGRERRVELVLDVAGVASRPDEPVVLIGTRLLSPHLLLIDFDAGTVEIKAQRP